ncbi:hypothetical protein [Corynebacterium diphtheriae]|uniref:hypothetical protein n=1 Tax=Corynebacterium diphtheriae TaxID=1717 RepID=UPI0009CC5E79|nr:hypothetical protein [Corynebacterium diphtheriae]MBG9293951.1 hypothetical protein [Corynebacterium diphtheriae bv. mitis]ONF69106.1 hypothetical protein BXA20_00240 [Corynebacterium diphtheriae]RNF49571.1 hypothetical protein EFE11_03835 [Corynebacterium diphtheriae]
MMIIQCQGLDPIRADEDENADLVKALRCGEFPGLVSVRANDGRKFHLNLSENVTFTVEFLDRAQDVGTPRAVRGHTFGNMQF